MEKKPKFKTRFVLPVLTGLVVCVLCAIVIWYWTLGNDGFKPSLLLCRLLDKLGKLAGIGPKCPGVRYVNTHSMFMTISSVVILYAQQSEDQLPSELSPLLDFIKERDSGDLERELVKRGRLDPNTGTVIDYWGNPIRLVVKSPYNYRFISFGPNGKDEGRRGDDIIYDFDPSELRDVNELNKTKR